MVPFAVFMRGRHACLFGLPFLREIFMALPRLCHVSDATADLRAKKKRIKTNRWCRI